MLIQFTKKILKLIKNFLTKKSIVVEQVWYVWLSLLIAIFGFMGLGISNWSTSQKVSSIQQELQNIQPSFLILQEYFKNIEQGKLDEAWKIFSSKKQENTTGGLEGFKNWLKYFVAFEGLKITELKEKNSALTKVYIAEFDFKQRGMKPVHSIWGIYMKNYNEIWKIDYTNILFENGWKDGACDFYSKFNICNK
jgi:hypothetical protein